MHIMDIFTAAQQTFERMYASLQLPALLLDENLRISHVNEAFVRLSGCDVQPIAGAAIGTCLEGPVADSASGCGQPCCGKCFGLKLPEGGLLPVALLQVPLHDAQGVCRGWLLFITGEESPAAAFKLPGTPGAAMPETRDFLLKIIEASYDGIVIADMNDVCLHVNSALEHITGYSRDFLIGRRFSDYIDVENWADELNESKVARVDETGQISYEASFRRGDGRVVYLENGVSLVRNNAGDCIATVWIVRDITGKKMVDQELKQAYEYRSRFFANVTHAFRTPLTLCIGPLENMLQGDCGPLDAPVARQIQTVLSSSRLLMMMVDHLLDFSRLQAGTITITPARIDVRSMSTALLESFQRSCALKNITLACRMSDDLPPLYTDPVHLRAVFHDLMSCALAAAPAGSAISVTAGQVPAHAPEGGCDTPSDIPREPALVVRLHCSGISLSAEQFRSLCELSGSSEIEADTGGFTMGIRLLHAQGLAGALGGSLAVEPLPSGGTCFVMQLPFGDARQVADAPATVAPAPACTCDEPDGSAVEIGDVSGPVSGTRPLVMIVEDNPALSAYISTIVRREYDAVAVRDGVEALEKMQDCIPDLILSDIMMPGMDGYALLHTVKASERFRMIPFVFLTARADVDMKIAGLEEGADDYIVKPFNAHELRARIKSLLRLRGLMMRNEAQARQISSMSSRLQERYRYGVIIGKSAPMRKMYQLLDSIRDSDANVLVTGETGTGKELVANSIHFNSRRSAGPLISVNCGAIPRELMEREFFGHVKGAYTGAIENRRGYFAEASAGTLFLDEIGEMDRDMQVKLLRVIERGEISRVGDPIPHRVDVRLIAATNKDLRAEVRAGRFREDLYYRLYVIPVHVPPLRERREDIALLIDHFREKLKRKMNIDIPQLTEQDYRFFSGYDYPGNVRELENLIERCCFLGGSARDLVDAAAPTRAVDSGLCNTDACDYDGFFAHPDPLKRARDSAERALIMHALRECGNNHADAARKLGIARSSLYRKINEFKSGP